MRSLVNCRADSTDTMKTEGITALVTGGASGLGLASAQRLVDAGARVVIVDLPGSAGADVASQLGAQARFAAADVTSDDEMAAACDAAAALGDFRVLVHCAGRGGPVRLIDKEGNPGSLATYENIVRINLDRHLQHAAAGGRAHGAQRADGRRRARRLRADRVGRGLRRARSGRSAMRRPRPASWA